ncbi:MAG: apolipoprotein N-acyltransferase, partial [Mycobacteriales bacterium]
GFRLPGLVRSKLGGLFAFAVPFGGSLLAASVPSTAGVALAALVLLPGIGRRAVGAGAALVAASVPLVAGAAVHTQPAGTLDAAVVQGGGPRGTRAVFTDPDKVTARQLAVARTISGSPDLVLLPEGVVVVDAPLAAAPESAQLAELARRLRTTLVVGVVEAEADGFRNAAVSYSPEGTIVDRYEKKHRVPFGEYIPARELLSRFTDATALVPSDAIVGQTASVLRLPTGVLGVVISYEIFFADRVREAVTGGGQLIVLPTNASSYVSDEVPATEVAAARLRAREFGRAVLQAAPTGYSVIVLPGGDVLAQSELGGPALLRATVPLRTGLTPYARIGDLPAVGLALVAVLSPGSRRRRAPPATRPTRRQRSRTPEGPLEAASPTTLRRRK